MPRGPGEVVSVPGPHVRGSPLRASGTGLTGGDGEVDLVLPGTARYTVEDQLTFGFHVHVDCALPTIKTV